MFDGTNLQFNVGMSGPLYLEDTYCRLRIDEKTAREAKIKLTFVAISGSDKPFKSPLSGFLGIGPYNQISSVEEQRKNFMVQLKEQQLIDNNIMSFYVRGRNDKFSHIKFGSWDNDKISQ